MKDTYWIEIINTPEEAFWYWKIKCINGTIKATGKMYSRKFTCVADAKAFAEYTGLTIR
jgi:hypothetical protein